MACLRCPQSDFGGFPIANFSDHNHIGILTEYGRQTTSECQTDARVYLHLVDTVEQVLDWILDGNNITTRVRNQIQCRVQGRGFPRTCWPSHDKHALRLPEKPNDGC